MSIRNTARRLKLHSPSSYRFERGVDPAGVDWASRRCCELILEIAGGELAAGVIDVGREVPRREPIVLRLAQLKRILGIDVPPEEVRRILAALGTKALRSDDQSLEVVPPTWRRDLEREIDLVEEVARVHGYDKIPEDVSVPMTASHRSDRDRVLEIVRGVLTASGFDEALKESIVPDAWTQAFTPWTAAPPLVSDMPMSGILAKAVEHLAPANRLRRSLIPSLLEVRRVNESIGNREIELFETARAYLPREGGLPDEPVMVGLAGSGGYFELKGVVEAIVAALKASAALDAREASLELLDPARSCELRLGGDRLGYLGEVAPQGLKSFGLRLPATVAELRLDVLEQHAALVPQYAAESPFPAISQDLNFIVAESLRWSDLAGTVRAAAGELLEQVVYRETYRNPEADGAGKKRLLLSITLRSRSGTLTGSQAEEVRSRIVAACAAAHAASLLA
jgi:phenylalanyl-tRNA synthetase beta chain